MKTISVPVYSFSELSPEAKKRAVKDHAQFIAEIYDAADDLEIVKDDLKEAGYPDAEIAYSGFGSQGDGLSFTCTIDFAALKVPEKYAEAVQICRAEEIEVKLTRSTSMRYVHEFMMGCDAATYALCDDGKEAKVAALCAWILEDARSQARKAYRFLESCYFAALEDGAVVESIEANGYDFHADGTLATKTVRLAA